MERGYIHISFDDVYECIYDITLKKYSSLFENPFLGELYKLHEQTGAVFTLNCFNTCTKQPDYDIGSMPERYAKEWRENAGWLKLAFHAEDDMANYGDGLSGHSTLGQVMGDCEERAAQSYRKFTKAALRAAGTPEIIDRVTRLGFFAGTEKNILALKQCKYGITGLLCADDTRVSYYLEPGPNKQVWESGQYYDERNRLLFLRSELRLERVEDVSAQLKLLQSREAKGRKEALPESGAGEPAAGSGILEIFTHEYEYPNIRHILPAYLDWAVQRGYRFAFAQERMSPQ